LVDFKIILTDLWTLADIWAHVSGQRMINLYCNSALEFYNF